MRAVIADRDLEDFLGPVLIEWNRLGPAGLRALRAAPLECDSGALVTYVGEERTPYGYEYVELEISKPAFVLNVRVEGVPGNLSMAAYLPVLRLQGDEAECNAMLGAASSAAR
jgi:hypothetical protein